MPQSNQRGIETRDGAGTADRMDVPQSNQRGIETVVRAVSDAPPGQCLNRTSVGLKPLFCWLNHSHPCAPQSNQRGIETSLSRSNKFRSHRASIEPAWD